MNLRKENETDLTIADQQVLAQTIIELSDEEMENVIGGCSGPQGYGNGYGPNGGGCSGPQGYGSGCGPTNGCGCGCNGYGNGYGNGLGYGYGGGAFPFIFGGLGGL